MASCLRPLRALFLELPKDSQGLRSFLQERVCVCITELTDVIQKHRHSLSLSESAESLPVHLQSLITAANDLLQFLEDNSVKYEDEQRKILRRMQLSFVNLHPIIPTLKIGEMIRLTVRSLLANLATMCSIMGFVHESTRSDITKWLSAVAQAGVHAAQRFMLPSSLQTKNNTFIAASTLLEQAIPLCTTFVEEFMKFCIYRYEAVVTERNRLQPQGQMDTPPSSTLPAADENPVADGLISLVPPVGTVRDFDCARPEDPSEEKQCHKRYLSTSTTGRRTGIIQARAFAFPPLHTTHLTSKGVLFFFCGDCGKVLTASILVNERRKDVFDILQRYFVSSTLE